MAAIAPPSGGGGGYDYQFVKTPSDMLICTVCFLPSKQPYLSECCGHTFCKSCLEGSKKFSNICPMCRSEDFKAIFNKQADRVIRSLHVFCTNKKQGCEWQGEVNNITNHHGNCLFQIVHCPNDCGASLQRQYLIIHVENECPRRRVNCQYCNGVGEYQFIKGQHKEECLKFPIQCPNKCEIKSICRDEVEEHREICPLEMIQCDYHVVGCRVKMTRKDINTHKQETMEEHLSLSINELMETKRQFKSAQLEVENSTNEQLATVKQSSNNALVQLKQQLSASQQETRKTREDLTKQLIQTEKNLTAKLTASQQETRKTREDLTKQLIQTEKNLTAKLTASQQEAKWTKDQLLQKLTATEKELNTTKQQLATTCQNLTKAEKEHTTLAASTDKALTEMENKFQAKITAAENRIAELEKKLQQNTKQIEEGSWLTSLHNRASMLSSGNEVVPVVVKMTEFTKHKDADWLSNSFYDNRTTCKLQLRIFVNRDDSTYMSMCLIKVLQSKRPAGRFAVRLLNQISDRNHYQVQSDVFVPINTIWQKKFFISYKDLHKSTAEYQYLRDDTLFFEVLKV